MLALSITANGANGETLKQMRNLLGGEIPMETLNEYLYSYIKALPSEKTAKLNVAEDPVCGSGHCHIVPYWAQKLSKSELTAYQASPRSGVLYCRMEGERVILAGKAALYAKAEIAVPEDAE